MSIEKKAETLEPEATTKAPDSLAKTSKKGDGALTEDQLKRIDGGLGKGEQKKW
jgi:hypothetical protein